MARISALPGQAIIDGFKGVIDFYIYKGQACVRKWPHWRPREATGPEAKAQQAFGYVNTMARVLPEYVIDQYRAMAVSTKCSWKDIYIRGYLYGSRHR